MKILFDYQIFSMMKFGGISRYFAELYDGLQNERNCVSELAVKNSANINYQHIISKSSSYSRMEMFLFRSIGKFIHGFKEINRNHAYSFKKIFEGDFDIFHPTFYNPYFLDVLKGKPYVVTAYDMIHELFPNYFREDVLREIIEWKKCLFENAHHVIAISNHTKEDVLKFYSISHKKITTIHLASSIKEQTSRLRTLNIVQNKEYLLFVGNREIYKNFQLFAETFSSIVKNTKGLFLVCAGPVFSPEEKNLFDILNIQKNIIQLFPTDEELISLYQHAIALVYPSRYEGFGLPLLEAFACECPVIASYSSSLPEVGGEAVLYFPPDDKDALIHQIEKVLNDSLFRQEMIEKGHMQLKLFSWKKTVHETKKVYENVLR